MTLYHADVYVPANTPKESPVEYKLTIKDEVITKISVTFPWGCNGMVHVAIFYGPYQLFPRPDGTSLHDNGTRIEANMYWECPERETELTIKAWSPGTEYDHTIFVDVEAMPKTIAAPHTVFERLISLLRRILFGW